jgi:hypothetical protein
MAHLWAKVCTLAVLLFVAGCGESAERPGGPAQSEPDPDDEDPPSQIAIPPATTGCGCAAHELCSNGRCHPRIVVTSWVLLGGTAGFPSLKTGTFQPDGGSAAASVEFESGCSLGSGQGSSSRYAWKPFDIGEVNLQVKDGDSFEFPPLEDGIYDNDYSWEMFDVSPGGGDVVYLTVGGGIDAPANIVTATMPPRVIVDEVEPIVLGEDWTVSWSPEAPVVRLTLSTEINQPSITCVVKGGTTVTVPAEFTERLEEPTEQGGYSLHWNVWGERAQSVADGVTLELRGLRLDFPAHVPLATEP